jgi:hypothetical protein
MVVIIVVLVIPLITAEKFIVYISKDITLSVACSILAGAITFIIIEFFSRVFHAGKKDSLEIYYDELFIQQGLESVFTSRGINHEYEKRILKAKHRILAIGMTNSNLIQKQLDNIVSRVAAIKSIEVIISFWSADSSFIKTYEKDKEISIINQQLLIETGQKIDENSICAKYDKIKNKCQEKLKSNTGNLKIVEMTLPSNFTCFIIDDDVFFFPFLANVDSTSSPIILCNIHRGIGSQITQHIEKILSEPEITRTIYESQNP